MIDEQLTNQIVILLPVRGRTEFSNMYGIDCRCFLLCPLSPPSSSTTPSPLLPRHAPPRARLEKERKRLLRRQVSLNQYSKIHSFICQINGEGKGQIMLVYSGLISRYHFSTSANNRCPKGKEWRDLGLGNWEYLRGESF